MIGNKQTSNNLLTINKHIQDSFKTSVNDVKVREEIIQKNGTHF